MNGKDAAAEAAKMVGGWEKYARGLHELVTTGEIKLLDEALQREGLKRLLKAFGGSVKRGAPRKHEFSWYLNASDRLEQIRKEKPCENKVYAVGRLAKELYEEEWCGYSRVKKDKKIKSLTNRLGEHDRIMKRNREKYTIGCNSALR